MLVGVGVSVNVSVGVITEEAQQTESKPGSAMLAWLPSAEGDPAAFSAQQSRARTPGQTGPPG